MQTATAKKPARKNVAPGGSLFTISMGGKRYPAPSLKAARDLWCDYRDENDMGMRDLRRTDGYVTRNGKQVGHISYNGRFWRKTKGEC